MAEDKISSSKEAPASDAASADEVADIKKVEDDKCPCKKAKKKCTCGVPKRPVGRPPGAQESTSGKTAAAGAAPASSKASSCSSSLVAGPPTAAQEFLKNNPSDKPSNKPSSDEEAVVVLDNRCACKRAKRKCTCDPDDENYKIANEKTNYVRVLPFLEKTCTEGTLKFPILPDPVETRPGHDEYEDLFHQLHWSGLVDGSDPVGRQELQKQGVFDVREKNGEPRFKMFTTGGDDDTNTTSPGRIPSLGQPFLDAGAVLVGYSSAVWKEMQHFFAEVDTGSKRVNKLAQKKQVQDKEQDREVDVVLEEEDDDMAPVEELQREEEEMNNKNKENTTAAVSDKDIKKSSSFSTANAKCADLKGKEASQKYNWTDSAFRHEALTQWMNVKEYHCAAVWYDTDTLQLKSAFLPEGYTAANPVAEQFAKGGSDAVYTKAGSSVGGATTSTDGTEVNMKSRRVDSVQALGKSTALGWRGGKAGFGTMSMFGCHVPPSYSKDEPQKCVNRYGNFLSGAKKRDFGMEEVVDDFAADFAEREARAVPAGAASRLCIMKSLDPQSEFCLLPKSFPDDFLAEVNKKSGAALGCNGEDEENPVVLGDKNKNTIEGAAAPASSSSTSAQQLGSPSGEVLVLEVGHLAGAVAHGKNVDPQQPAAAPQEPDADMMEIVSPVTVSSSTEEGNKMILNNSDKTKNSNTNFVQLRDSASSSSSSSFSSTAVLNKNAVASGAPFAFPPAPGAVQHDVDQDQHFLHEQLRGHDRYNGYHITSKSSNYVVMVHSDSSADGSLETIYFYRPHWEKQGKMNVEKFTAGHSWMFFAGGIMQLPMKSGSGSLVWVHCTNPDPLYHGTLPTFTKQAPKQENVKHNGMGCAFLLQENVVRVLRGDRNTQNIKMAAAQPNTLDVFNGTKFGGSSSSGLQKKREKARKLALQKSKSKMKKKNEQDKNAQKPFDKKNSTTSFSNKQQGNKLTKSHLKSLLKSDNDVVILKRSDCTAKGNNKHKKEQPKIDYEKTKQWLEPFRQTTKGKVAKKLTHFRDWNKFQGCVRQAKVLFEQYTSVHSVLINRKTGEVRHADADDLAENFSCSDEEGGEMNKSADAVFEKLQQKELLLRGPGGFGDHDKAHQKNRLKKAASNKRPAEVDVDEEQELGTSDNENDNGKRDHHGKKAKGNTSTTTSSAVEKKKKKKKKRKKSKKSSRREHEDLLAGAEPGDSVVPPHVILGSSTSEKGEMNEYGLFFPAGKLHGDCLYDADADLHFRDGRLMPVTVSNCAIPASTANEMVVDFDQSKFLLPPLVSDNCSNNNGKTGEKEDQEMKGCDVGGDDENKLLTSVPMNMMARDRAGREDRTGQHESPLPAVVQKSKKSGTAAAPKEQQFSSPIQDAESKSSPPSSESSVLSPTDDSDLSKDPEIDKADGDEEVVEKVLARFHSAGCQCSDCAKEAALM
ncbi:unnamed protein product [Amoebophrya sp. A120]|nr:unnamed protein product [Amoebophrya sp. A120]|eukprot:GSA120T00000822001.1